MSRKENEFLAWPWDRMAQAILNLIRLVSTFKPVYCPKQTPVTQVIPFGRYLTFPRNHATSDFQINYDKNNSNTMQ